MSELKDCPLCGGNADAAIDGEYTIIQCQTCGCRTDGNLTSEMGHHWAKEEWNRRAEDRLAEENAELREMLQHVMKCAAMQDNELIDAEEIKKLLNK